MHTETHEHYNSQCGGRRPIITEPTSMAPAGPSPIAALRYVSEILSSGRAKGGTLALGIEAVHEARAVIERALTHHHHEWCMVGDCGCGRCVVCGELAAAKTADSAAYFAAFSEHEEDICTGCGEPLCT